MRISPITCWRPSTDAAADFASLPYDVFDRTEAAAYVSDHPHSFLAIDRPETQFAPEEDMYAPKVYQRARTILDEREQDGTLVHDGDEAYYVWRQQLKDREQTGIVASFEVDDYLSGTVARHENTRPEKEQDRIRHIRALDAQTGPIFLAYRDNASLDKAVSKAQATPSLYDFTDEQGVRETVWRVADADGVKEIREAFEQVPRAYIADGHHRAASAVRVSLERRDAAGAADAAHDAPFDRVLAVLFPAGQLKILPYNRVVADRRGMSAEELVSAIASAGFDVKKTEGPVLPKNHGETGMYADGSWWDLTLDPTLVPDDPVASLDASIVQNFILNPILGIEDPARDGRISFVGGIRGTSELERRAGADGVAFSMHATQPNELLAVADAGRLMPPKSTWFEPKLLSGLFIRPLN